MKKQLPKTLFVKREGIEGGDYLVADEMRDALVEPSGATEVGEYRLVETKKLKYVVQEDK